MTKKDKNAKRKKVEPSRIKSFISGIKAFFADRKVQFVLGALIAAFAVFFCFSYVSFFSTGGSDHDILETYASEGGNVKAENSGGIGGAVIAEYLVNGCFGWASILLFPLLVLWAIRLMHLCEIGIKRWTLMLAAPIVWFSLFFSFAIGDGFDSWYASPGGAHGDTITRFIEQMVGNVGVVILLVMLLLFYMIYVTSSTIPWLQTKLAISFTKKSDNRSSQ